MRRRKRRILAAGMVVVITCSSYGSVPRVYANTNFYQIREIESLSEQVLYQKVPYGTRYQDLEKEGGFEHHFGDKYPRNVAWHKVSIAKDSILEKTYGNREIRVNSFHHQAIKDAGENVRITAWSEDRVPEAMELEDHPFAVAVQWHPEMMYDSSEQMKLLQAFVKAAEKGTEA